MTTRLSTPVAPDRSRWAWLWEPRGTLALLLAWAGFHVLLRLALSSTLTADDAREAVLAQSLQWGYQARQPPLYNWLAWARLPPDRARAPRPHAREVRGPRPGVLARVPDGAADPDRPPARHARRLLVPPDRPAQLDAPRGADPQRHGPCRLRRDGLCPRAPRRRAPSSPLRRARPGRRARPPLEVHVRRVPRRARPGVALRGPVPPAPPESRDPRHRARRDASGPPVRALVRGPGPRPRQRVRPRGPDRGGGGVGRAGRSGSRLRGARHRFLPGADGTGPGRVLSRHLPARAPGGQRPARRPPPRVAPGLDARSPHAGRARRGSELPQGALAHPGILPGSAVRTVAPRAPRCAREEAAGGALAGPGPGRGRGRRHAVGPRRGREPVQPAVPDERAVRRRGRRALARWLHGRDHRRRFRRPRGEPGRPLPARARAPHGVPGLPAAPRAPGQCLLVWDRHRRGRGGDAAPGPPDDVQRLAATLGVALTGSEPVGAVEAPFRFAPARVRRVYYVIFPDGAGHCR